MAIGKNLFQVGRDQAFLNQGATPHGVFDFIADEGAVVALGECMLMHPEGRVRWFVDR